MGDRFSTSASELPETIRAFVAIRIPRRVIAQLISVQDQLKHKFTDVSWTREEGMHVTLQFLGNVESVRLPELTSALRMARQFITPFEIELAGLGSFGNRVLWVGVNRGAEPLTGLAEVVRRATKGFGVHEEGRTFNAHVTLGRFRQNERGVAGVLRNMPAPNFNSWNVNEFELIRSQLSPHGATHTTIEKFALQT